MADEKKTKAKTEPVQTEWLKRATHVWINGSFWTKAAILGRIKQGLEPHLLNNKAFFVQG